MAKRFIGEKNLLSFLVPSSPVPKYRFKSVLDITVEDLRKMGVKAVALDIDNTICNDGKENCIDGLEDWLKNVRAAEIKVIIISNAIGSRPKRIAKKLGLPCLRFARKPFAHKLIKGAKILDVSPCEMAMIGDQLFADIKAANRCGAVAVRVDPMKGETRYKTYYAKRRAKEAPILEAFEKNHGYGVYDE